MLSDIEVEGIPGSRGPRTGRNSICARQQGLHRTRSSRGDFPSVFSNWKSKENSETYQKSLEHEELSSHGKFQLVRAMVGTSEFGASKRDEKRDERRVAEGVIVEPRMWSRGSFETSRESQHKKFTTTIEGQCGKYSAVTEREGAGARQA